MPVVVVVVVAAVAVVKASCRVVHKVPSYEHSPVGQGAALGHHRGAHCQPLMDPKRKCWTWGQLTNTPRD